MILVRTDLHVELSECQQRLLRGHLVRFSKRGGRRGAEFCRSESRLYSTLCVCAHQRTSDGVGRRADKLVSIGKFVTFCLWVTVFRGTSIMSVNYLLKKLFGYFVLSLSSGIILIHSFAFILHDWYTTTRYNNCQQYIFLNINIL